MRVIPAFLFIFILFLACKDKPLTPEKSSTGIDYENHFFTLDFEKEGIGLEELQKYFFTNFPHNDPTQGDVVYDQSEWIHDDIIELKEEDALYAYTRYRADEKAYDSYRLTSKAYFNLNEACPKILFVFKGSLPSAKGMWPAWWLNGSREKTWTYDDDSASMTDKQLGRFTGKGPSHAIPSSVNNTDWPSAGEIDIIENINGLKEIHNTLHTCPQMCDSEWNNDGEIINCANSKIGDANPGCSGRTYEIEKPTGTFACIWEEKRIRFYYWPPSASVNDEGGPLHENPNPDLWDGESLKNTVQLLETNTDCKEEIHQPWQCNNCSTSNTCSFSNLKMVFNLTLCGFWAGNQFDDTANALKNCQEYIRGDGVDEIDDQFMKIEFVSVKKL